MTVSPVSRQRIYCFCAVVSTAALPLAKDKFILMPNLNAPCYCLNASHAYLHRWEGRDYSLRHCNSLLRSSDFYHTSLPLERTTSIIPSTFYRCFLHLSSMMVIQENTTQANHIAVTFPKPNFHQSFLMPSREKDHTVYITNCTRISGTQQHVFLPYNTTTYCFSHSILSAHSLQPFLQKCPL